MKSKTRGLIIFGIGDLAQIAKGYFNRDSEYTVEAFTIDKEYMGNYEWKLGKTELLGIPVVAFDEVERLYPVENYHMFAAIGYGNLNRDRKETCQRIKQKGYLLARYVSPRAYMADTASIGENSFIFENNVIQDFVEVGRNVIMWSGNHIGHHSIIEDNVFISSHCVISGHCRIKESTFIGVNATIGNNVTVGAGSWISPGAIITQDVPHNSLVKSVKSEVTLLNEGRLFG